jgi:hypothetical protein
MLKALVSAKSGDVAQSTYCVSPCEHSLLWLCGLVFQRKGRLVFSTVAWSDVLGRGRSHSRLRSVPLLPSMQFGRGHSIGHYLDSWSAVLGLSLFPVGYLLHSLTTAAT